RSNYYITAAGNNPAKTIVGDYIDNNLGDECKLSTEEVYWRYIPDKVVFNYIKGDLAAHIRQLIRNGKAYSSMRYDYDLRGNLKRRLFIFMHEHNHVKKFKKYYKI
nr:carboxylate--amine ligase [Clostridia bacterium]